jgi:hypothetical protein
VRLLQSMSRLGRACQFMFDGRGPSWEAGCKAMLAAVLAMVVSFLCAQLHLHEIFIVMLVYFGLQVN